jgi:hypothetical protein
MFHQPEGKMEDDAHLQPRGSRQREPGIISSSTQLYKQTHTQESMKPTYCFTYETLSQVPYPYIVNVALSYLIWLALSSKDLKKDLHGMC